MDVELNFSNLTDEEITAETDKFGDAMRAERNVNTACALASALLKITNNDDAIAICTVAAAIILRSLKGSGDKFELATALTIIGIKTSPETLVDAFNTYKNKIVAETQH